MDRINERKMAALEPPYFSFGLMSDIRNSQRATGDGGAMHRLQMVGSLMLYQCFKDCFSHHIHCSLKSCGPCPAAADTCTVLRCTPAIQVLHTTDTPRVISKTLPGMQLLPGAHGFDRIHLEPGQHGSGQRANKGGSKNGTGDIGGHLRATGTHPLFVSIISF